MAETVGVILKFLAIFLMFLELFLSSAACGSSADIYPPAVPKPNPISVIEGDEKIQSPLQKAFRRENLRNP